MGVDIVNVYVSPYWAEPLRNGTFDLLFYVAAYKPDLFHTAPILDNPFEGLLKVKVRPARYWSLFDPFHWRVWIAICASVVLGTVVAGAIAYINREWDPRKDPLEFGAMLYHSVTLILGGEDLSGVLLPRHDAHHPSRQTRRAGHGGVDRVRAAPPAGSALPRARHDGELHGEPRGVPHESAARRPRPEEPRRHEMRDAASYDAPS